MTQRPLVIVKNYRGSEQAASRAFQSDAAKLAAEGYFPTSQSWAPGRYGCFAFLLALLLCIVIIGIIIFIYMLVVPPDGTLSVTYTLKVAPASAAAVDEKTCPRCAEKVKAAAVVCRFCGHQFAAG